MIKHYDGVLGTFDYDDNDFQIVPYVVTHNIKHELGFWGALEGLEKLIYVGEETDGSKIEVPFGVKGLRGCFQNTGIKRLPKILDCTDVQSDEFRGCNHLIATENERNYWYFPLIDFYCCPRFYSQERTTADFTHAKRATIDVLNCLSTKKVAVDDEDGDFTQTEPNYFQLLYSAVYRWAANLCMVEGSIELPLNPVKELTAASASDLLNKQSIFKTEDYPSFSNLVSILSAQEDDVFASAEFNMPFNNDVVFEEFQKFVDFFDEDLYDNVACQAAKLVDTEWNKFCSTMNAF